VPPTFTKYRGIFSYRPVVEAAPSLRDQWHLRTRPTKMMGMRVRDFFLANYAEVKDSLAYVLGAFPEWWTVPSIPQVSLLFIVALLEYEESELHTNFKFDIHLQRPDGETVVLASVQTHRGVAPNDVPGSPRYQPVLVGSNIEFRGLGLHQFVLLSEANAELARASIMVRTQPPAGGYVTFGGNAT